MVGGVDSGKGPVHGIRPLVDRSAQDMLRVVVGEEEFHVAGVFKIPSLLDGENLLLDGVVHPRKERATSIGIVGRNTRHHVGNDDSLEMVLVFQRILDRQQSAPRLAEEEEIGGVETKRLTHLLDLIDKTLKLPKRGFVGLVARHGAELSVVVNLDAFAWEKGIANF
jgi:hypothetical protein